MLQLSHNDEIPIGDGLWEPHHKRISSPSQSPIGDNVLGIN